MTTGVARTSRVRRRGGWAVVVLIGPEAETIHAGGDDRNAALRDRESLGAVHPKNRGHATHTIWLGALADDGYGRFHDPDYADEALPAALCVQAPSAFPAGCGGPGMGPLPARTVVLHRCDLPICVRLDHLAASSQRDNLLMAASRDRIARMTFTGQRTDYADKRGQPANPTPSVTRSATPSPRARPTRTSSPRSSTPSSPSATATPTN